MRPASRLLPRTGPARRDLVLAVGLGVIAGALVVFQADRLSRLVDGAFLGGRSLGQLQPLALALAAAALARALVAWGGDLAAQRLAARMKLELRERLARHLLALGPRYLAGERTGELAQTMTGGIESLEAWYAQYLPQVAMAVLVPVLVGAFVFHADWLSGLVLLLTFPLIPLFMALIGGLARERTRRQWVTLSRMSARFLDALQGLATLRAFGRGADHAAALEEAGEGYRRITMGVLRVAFLSGLVLELIATLSTAVVAVEVGLRLLYGRIGFREALFVLVLAPEFYRPLRALGAAFHAGMAGAEAAGRVFEVLDTPPMVPSGPAAPAVGESRPPAGEPPAVAFEAVTFEYAAGAPPALDGVSFDIEPGTTLALVGPSGAGKTTAAHLLLRFLEPGRGRIRVDGRPLSERDPDEWRRHVAWVPQRPHLFHGTVLDNLRLARPEATRDEVEAAAHAASALAFVRELPRGFDTPVGEDGARLSGGQAQRIALARAFLRAAPVLVLDEPTSQLDPEQDALVREAMARLRRGRTVLLIAHRLPTVFDAARIVLLSGGRVIEEGTHRGLLAEGRLYPRLVAAWRGGPGTGLAGEGPS